jgi:hypothetical protein
MSVVIGGNQTGPGATELPATVAIQVQMTRRMPSNSVRPLRDRGEGDLATGHATRMRSRAIEYYHAGGNCRYR